MDAIIKDLGMYSGKKVLSIYDSGDGGMIIWNELKFSYCGEEKVQDLNEAIDVIRYQLDNESLIFDHMNPYYNKEKLNLNDPFYEQGLNRSFGKKDNQ